MKGTIERRFLPGLEIRAAMKSGKRTISGYAAVFNSPSSPLLGFTEYCKPGCFSRALKEKQDVRCLQNHDPNLLLGRTTNRTLTLREDGKGLWYECELPDTQAGRDTFSLVQRGDMSQCSFSFIPKKDKWGKDRNAAGNSKQIRDLLDVDLLDVSPVTYPVYEATAVTSSRDEDCGDDEDCEDITEPKGMLRSMFPNGIPPEIRSHVPTLARRFSVSHDDETTLGILRCEVELAEMDLDRD
jgi:uncharacterized protein